MINLLLGQVLLREVPRHLAAGVTSGQYQIYGSIIRKTMNGQIVGALQEAAPLAAELLKLNPAMLNPVTMAVTTGADLAMKAAQLTQGEVVRREVVRVEGGVGRLEQGLGRLEGRVAALNQLGVANLAMSAAGIGISVAGFALLANRIDGVKRAVDGLTSQMETISTKIDAVRQDLIDADFSELRALARALDEGWLLTEAAAQNRWLDVSYMALSIEDRFVSRARHLLEQGASGYLLADPMLDAISMTGGIRVAALSATDNTVAAKMASADNARTVEQLTGNIGLADLARQQLTTADPSPGSQDWTLAMAAANEATRPLVKKIRDREAAVATRAAPLFMLEDKGIRPREWLEAVREEKEAPVLLMMADGAKEG